MQFPGKKFYHLEIDLTSGQWGKKKLSEAVCEVQTKMIENCSRIQTSYCILFCFYKSSPLFWGGGGIYVLLPQFPVQKCIGFFTECPARHLNRITELQKTLKVFQSNFLLKQKTPYPFRKTVVQSLLKISENLKVISCEKKNSDSYPRDGFFHPQTTGEI